MDQGPDPDPSAFEAKPKRKRREHDAYPTVDELATAIVGHVAVYCGIPERVVEPTCGDGAFVRALRKQYFIDTKIAAVDIDPQYETAALKSGASKFIHADFLSLPAAALTHVDLIVGNPPFSAAAAIIAKCVREAPAAIVAFILPVGFVGQTKERNADFWKACPIRYFAPIHPRPSFTNDGRTDRMEYALFGFGARWDGDAGIGDPIVWRVK
jgi:hypothetical protein